jgi:DNA adenine methylase
LNTLSQIKGKFILSSYPSAMLKEYAKRFGRKTKEIQQHISVNAKEGIGSQKKKTEVVTWNFD